MFRYRHQRLWDEWVGSFMILLALLEQRVRKMSRMEGKGAMIIFSGVFTDLWRVLWSAALQLPYQTVMQMVITLSMVPFQNVVKMVGGRLALFSRRRKFRRCCAFLVWVRSSVMSNPRNFLMLTLSTVVLTSQWGVVSRAIKTLSVFFTLRDRLFVPHDIWNEE